jgi:hypothetical protein
MITILHYLAQTHDQHYEYHLNKSPVTMVPTNNHPLFDGTQTSLGSFKLGATYLGKALV